MPPPFGEAMRRHERPRAAVGVAHTPLGRLLIAEGPRGILAIHFLDVEEPDRVLASLKRRFDLVENDRAAQSAGAEIRRFLNGERSALSRRADLTLVESPFQRRALKRLCRLPAGSVVTYRGLAEAVGAPRSQRAIGNTMASNPVPIYVPCHRVVRSDGTVGHYGGGIERKVKLLRAEGFSIGRDLQLHARTVLGHPGTHVYCRPECAAGQRTHHSRLLRFADCESARRAGMRPCGFCRPG